MRGRTDFWRRALMHGWHATLIFLGVLTAVIGGSAVAYWKFAHHRPLVVIVGAVLVIGLFMEGAYRRYAQAQAELDRLLTEPVGPQHIDVRHWLQAFGQAVVNDNACVFGDPPDGRAVLHEVFAAHFPKLVGEVDRWNEAISRRDGATHILRRRFEEQAHARGITDPPYHVDHIVTQLTQWTAQRARTGQLGEEFDLRWAGFGNPEDVEAFATMADGRPAIDLRSIARPEWCALMNRVTGLFADAQAWSEASEVRASEEALTVEWKVRLRDALNAEQVRQQFARASGCPACEVAISPARDHSL